MTASSSWVGPSPRLPQQRIRNHIVCLDPHHKLVPCQASSSTQPKPPPTSKSTASPSVKPSPCSATPSPRPFPTNSIPKTKTAPSQLAYHLEIGSCSFPTGRPKTISALSGHGVQP